MSSEEFEREGRRALALYCAGVKDGSFEDAMDRISAVTDDEQWETLNRWLEEADMDIGPTAAATLAQRERAHARLNGRPSRYPSMFALYAEDENAFRLLAELEAEHGIKAPDYGRRKAPRP